MWQRAKIVIGCEASCTEHPRHILRMGDEVWVQPPARELEVLDGPRRGQLHRFIDTNKRCDGRRVTVQIDDVELLPLFADDVAEELIGVTPTGV